MSYRGQTIQEFNVTRDEALFSSNSRQIILFTRIVLPTLALITLLFAIFQENNTTEDLIGYTLIIILLAIVYFRIIKRLKKFQEFDLENLHEALIIMEYGIEFPPFTLEHMDLTTEEYFSMEPVFLTYNEISTIKISAEEIVFQSEEHNHHIDLNYFPFYSESSELTYEEQITYFIAIIEKISKNLEKIENRDHPTIIPKAYFKDILSTIS